MRQSLVSWQSPAARKPCAPREATAGGRGVERRHRPRPPVAVLLVAVLTGCTAAGTPLPEIAPEINSTWVPYHKDLIPGDVVSVRFAEVNKFDHIVRVGLDGTCTFFGLEEPVLVAGRPLEDLRAHLEVEYSKFLVRPRVWVSVIDLSARGVLVLGEVQEPGVVAIVGSSRGGGGVQVPGARLSFLETLARVGGHEKATAELKSVFLIRQDPNTGEQMKWRIDARPKYWGIGPPLWLQPLDVVFVPNQMVDKVAIAVDNYVRRLIPVPRFVPLPRI